METVRLQINLKPSALKNELNAAIHFIKYVQTMQNLGTTNPQLNASLENTKGLIATFQV